MVLLFAANSLACPSPNNKVLSLSPHFRTMAEDFVDCVDELSALSNSSKDVYDAQDTRCADKRKKMARQAATADERQMASMLREFYMQEATCKLVREVYNRGSSDYRDCLDTAELMRGKAVKQGALRMK
jgi:hypothetical protein